MSYAAIWKLGRFVRVAPDFSKGTLRFFSAENYYCPVSCVAV